MMSFLRSGFLLAFCLAALWVLGANDFNVGTDLGIHYQFALDISRFSTWPLPAEAESPVMAHYPPAAHVLAVLLGPLAGSTLNGILVVTAISFVVIYLAIAELIRRETATATCWALALFIVVGVICRSGRFLEGNEVVANFFFAQFAGTAGLLAGFLLLFSMRTRPFLLWLTTAALATHLVGWIYQVSAIELALSCVMLQVVSFRRDRLREWVAKVLVSAAVLASASIIHPTMIGSTGIAGNDGSISISIYSLVIGSLLLLTGTIILIANRNRTRLVNADAVAALSLGTVCACALQVTALLAFGAGSAYAVKKYGFLIGTMSIVVAISLFLDRFAPGFPANGGRLPEVLAAAFVPLFGVAALVVVTADRGRTPVNLLTAYDGAVRQFWKQNYRPELDGNTIAWSSSVSPHVNYTVGLGVLRPKAAVDDQHALFLPGKPLTGAATFILTDSARARSLADTCLVAGDEAFAIVQATCMAGRAQLR
jgi:hypothetical protein